MRLIWVFFCLTTEISFFADCLKNRVKEYGKIEFRKSFHPLTTCFEFLEQEYVIDLKPNLEVYHQNFRFVSSDGVIPHSRSEYVGIVREPYFGEAALSKSENGQYTGFIVFYNDTLYLENNFFLETEFSESDIIGYFVSKTNSTLKFISGFENISLRLPNPFLKYYRKKRSADFEIPEPEKLNRCPLKIVADYSFFSIIGRNNSGIVSKYLVNLISRVNQIFKPVDWDEGKEQDINKRGRFVNMGFTIKEIKLLDRPNTSLNHYNSYNKTWHSNSLLSNFASEEASTDFCLVLLVTSRAFIDQDTVGLAYTSASGNGGICFKQLNCLLANTLKVESGLKMNALTTKEFDIAVSHEFGHSWGSHHDPTMILNDDDVENCVGDEQNGRYLMNAYLNTGYDKNNDKFSPCSKNMIRKTLDVYYDRCFESEKTSFCGNGIVEEGEECDNGNEVEEAHCCDAYCRFIIGAKCSPLNHVCCTEKCTFQNSSYVCLNGDPQLCIGDSKCNGLSGECPPAPPVENGLACIEDGECLNGECVPFCEKKSIGKKSCSCGQPQYLCHRCCRQKNGTCLPEYGGGLLRDGTKCSEGYCRNNKCVNAAIDNIQNYFSFETPSTFYRFLRTNFVIFLIIIITIVFFSMRFIVRLREKITSENKKRMAGQLIRPQATYFVHNT